MNMHGIIEPARLEEPERMSLVVRTRDWARRKRMFLLIVVLPALIVGGYLYLIASDQYQSEAHFLVRSSESSPTPASGFGALLSSATGAAPAQNEAMSVADYLTSHDVVEALRKTDNLVGRFHRDDADVLSRLSKADPTPEALLKYYRKQIRVQFNTETGITVLSVKSFRPEDSYQLATKLLQLGEQRVNVLNERSYRDAVSMSERQLANAEQALAGNQARLTAYRQSRADIDPKAQGTAQITLVSTLTAQLSAARAQLAMMSKMISRSSPQYHALEVRERALQAQIAQQSGRLTGGERTIANDIGGYEDLQLRQTYLSKQYDSAATALQNAREQAQRQQLYVVRVVNPNLPVKSLYPERARTLATVVVALLLIYSIGWLIAAGVREHAA